MISKSTSQHFNQLASELREDPRALEKQFATDFGRVLGGITPPLAVEPMGDDAEAES